jgi:hypothetical protein
LALYSWVGVLFLGPVAQAVIFVAVVAQAGLGTGQSSEQVVVVALQEAVGIDAGDSTLFIVLIVEFELAAVLDGRGAAQLVMLAGFPEPVAEAQPGLPVAWVLVDLAYQRTVTETEQAFSDNRSELAFDDSRWKIRTAHKPSFILAARIRLKLPTTHPNLYIFIAFFLPKIGYNPPIFAVFIEIGSIAWLTVVNIIFKWRTAFYLSNHHGGVWRFLVLHF